MYKIKSISLLCANTIRCHVNSFDEISLIREINNIVHIKNAWISIYFNVNTKIVIDIKFAQFENQYTIFSCKKFEILICKHCDCVFRENWQHFKKFQDFARFDVQIVSCSRNWFFELFQCRFDEQNFLIFIIVFAIFFINDDFFVHQ